MPTAKLHKAIIAATILLAFIFGALIAATITASNQNKLVSFQLRQLNDVAHIEFLSRYPAEQMHANKVLITMYPEYRQLMIWRDDAVKQIFLTAHIRAFLAAEENDENAADELDKEARQIYREMQHDRLPFDVIKSGLKLAREIPESSP